MNAPALIQFWIDNFNVQVEARSGLADAESMSFKLRLNLSVLKFSRYMLQSSRAGKLLVWRATDMVLTMMAIGTVISRETEWTSICNSRSVQGMETVSRYECIVTIWADDLQMYPRKTTT